MRRRDALWWALFGAGCFAVLATGAWAYANGQPSHLLFALIVAYGITLSIAFRALGVRRIWPKRSPDNARR
ncbi:hypothetical protein GCM10011608_27020 [Micromonospora sonchi]|uniref:Uncharacterized protein n=1 Tax=Micromonospora sonchi TaxID=1763543 RepID=A0A917TWY6_9ACTN|nr:hypothetical protein [Micromonospora sonchi]GGM40863.1 hypothetical protein GCM10011608_27020 [Micromonospora sonchi]